MRLKNRIAIVTGAARGIGLAIAERFIAEGATVVISDVTDAEGEAAAKKIGASYIHCDVAKSADVNALVSAVTARHGAIDILVNNAGIAIVRGVDDLTEADFDQTMLVNLKSADRNIFTLRARLLWLVELKENVPPPCGPLM